MNSHIASFYIQRTFMVDQTLCLKNSKVGYVRTYLIRKQNDLRLNQANQRDIVSGANQLLHMHLSLSC